MTCPYQLSLPFLIFIPNRSTLTVPLMYSFLIRAGEPEPEPDSEPWSQSILEEPELEPEPF